MFSHLFNLLKGRNKNKKNKMQTINKKSYKTILPSSTEEMARVYEVRAKSKEDAKKLADEMAYFFMVSDSNK